MKKERADTGDMDEALEREQEKKRQEEEKKKEQEPEFRKRLSALLEKAGKQDGRSWRRASGALPWMTMTGTGSASSWPPRTS